MRVCVCARACMCVCVFMLAAEDDAGVMCAHARLGNKSVYVCVYVFMCVKPRKIQ